MLKFYGAHINGGIEKALLYSEKYDFNSAQIMPTAPIRWALKDIDTGKLEQTISGIDKGKLKLKKILIHGIYLINLARKEKQKFHLSKVSLLNYLNYADFLQRTIESYGLDIEILGVCFHPGSAIDLDEQEGLVRVAEGLDWILEEYDGSIKLLLESSAGAGNVLGDKLEELAEMRELSKYSKRIGFVLDTQHMWASGYDWRRPENLFSEIEKVLQFENIKAIHLNDTKTELGSRKDRHDNLFDGLLGEGAVKEIVKREELENIPLIMETPDLGSEKGIRREIEKIKSII